MEDIWRVQASVQKEVEGRQLRWQGCVCEGNVLSVRCVKTCEVQYLSNYCIDHRVYEEIFYLLISLVTPFTHPHIIVQFLIIVCWRVYVVGYRLFYFQTNRERKIENKTFGRKKRFPQFLLCMYVCVYVCVFVCLFVCCRSTDVIV